MIRDRIAGSPDVCDWIAFRMHKQAKDGRHRASEVNTRLGRSLTQPSGGVTCLNCQDWRLKSPLTS